MNQQNKDNQSQEHSGSAAELSPRPAQERCEYCQVSEPYPTKVGWAHEGGVFCQSRINQLRQQVINTSIALYFTDGSDDNGDGAQMRWRYAQHHLAVNELMAAKGNRVFRTVNEPERDAETTTDR